MTETRDAVHKARWSARKGLRLVGIASLGLSALLFVLPHSASATTNSLTEQAGLPSPFSSDGTPPSPDVDITALSDTYQNGQITLALQTADPIDPTAAGSSYFVNWGIWVDGDSDPTKLDYVVQFGNDGDGDQGTQILNAQSLVQSCTLDTSFADQQFSMAFPASCIGNPTSIEVAAFVETLEPTVPTDVQYDVAPDGVNGVTACCEATDTTTSSSTTTSSTAIMSTSTTTVSTTTTSTVPSTSIMTSASTTTSTVPSTSTTTTAASTTATTAASTSTSTSPTTTTTTTAPSTDAATSVPTTTTTNPVQLADSTAGSDGGTTGGTAAPSGGGSSATQPNDPALAFTGINGAVLKWLLLLGGFLMLVGSMGRRWAVVRVRTARELSWRGGGALVLVMFSVIGTAAAMQRTGNAAPRVHDQSNASSAPAVPSDSPLMFGGSDLNPPGQQPSPSPHLAQSTVDAIESPNWSGYVATASESSPITDVQGTWTVPNVALSWTPTHSSAWIGIDGGEKGDVALAQVGTEQDSYYGFTSYSAWWSTADEDYLAIPITVDGQPLTVDPGDLIKAEVDQSAAGQVSFTLDDGSDQSVEIPTTYQGTGLTAEWVLEAPSILSGSSTTVSTLANYGSMVFHDLSTNEQLNSVDLNDDEDVLMVNQAGDVISYPSTPSANGDAFALAFGSTQPAPPSGEAPISSVGESPRPPFLDRAAPDELALPHEKFSP